jgi:predicted SAM-dependent methyltransferase
MNLRRLLRQSHLYAGFEDDLNRLHVLLLKLKTRIVVPRYLAAHIVRKLQIGAGPTQSQGWLTTDIQAKLRRKTVYLDAIAPYPIPDASIDYVFSEHMIEHVPYAGARAMLSECHRVLKRGGRIRLATPDLTRMLALMSPQPDATAREYVAWVHREFLPRGTPSTAIHVLNNQFRNYGHQFLYDEACLRELLIESGFTNVMRYEVGESDDPHLKGVEQHGKNVCNDKMIAFETMVLEAVKA